MITVEQILASGKAKRSKPDKEDLRRLPFRKAFIYGRVSSPGQVRDSHESIREIASLVVLAKEDGYKTGLHPDQVEDWLLSIQKGTGVKGVMEDGEVLVNVQDLGLSGQLSSDRREGLTKLQRSIEAGQTGAVYVTEGVGRLSRDQDRILPFQLLKMLKEHQCRLRTPEGIWNPAIDSDWEVLAEEFEDAIGELKVWRKRLFRRKAQKATRGEFVGEPIPAGYIPVHSGTEAQRQVRVRQDAALSSSCRGSKAHPGGVREPAGQRAQNGAGIGRPDVPLLSPGTGLHGTSQCSKGLSQDPGGL